MFLESIFRTGGRLSTVPRKKVQPLPDPRGAVTGAPLSKKVQHVVLQELM
jgi:hypothetical protein